MLRLDTFLLVAFAAALWIYAYRLPPSDAPRDLAEITRISAAPDREGGVTTIVRSFAPPAVPARVIASAQPDNNETRVEPSAQPRPSTWSAVVTSGDMTTTPLKSSRAADSATRIQLARDLQRELQRVGCYGGEITGTWNAATRHAMGTFMDRANAVLPYTEPDYVLLALVQSHQEITCSTECPAGQAMDDGGRCIPEAVVAQSMKKSKRLEERRLTEERLFADRQPVAPGDPEILPWQKAEPPSGRDFQVAIAPRPNPLPGRMSIGAPLPVDAAPPQSAVATNPALVAAVPAATTPAPADATAPDATPQVAALQYDPDVDDPSDAPGVIPSDPLPDALDAEAHKSKKRRSSEKESRPRYDSYASTGKRRHGDPRPGTARFNLMQSLGGVY